MINMENVHCQGINMQHFPIVTIKASTCTEATYTGGQQIQVRLCLKLDLDHPKWLTLRGSQLLSESP